MICVCVLCIQWTRKRLTQSCLLVKSKKEDVSGKWIVQIIKIDFKKSAWQEIVDIFAEENSTKEQKTALGKYM